MSYEFAYDKMSLIEGTYSDDPDDQDLETFAGISRRWFPDWDGWSIIDKIKLENPHNYTWLLTRANPENADIAKLMTFVKEFYYVEFWMKPGLGELNEISSGIANKIFRLMVNFGPERPAKWLQKSLNLLNRNQESYPDIKVDGDIGPTTRQTLRDASHNNPNKRILTVMKCFQGHEYINIMMKDPTQEKWIGWFDRIDL